MHLRIELDEQATEQLQKTAAADRRPLSWQAEVLLKHALEQLCRQEQEAAQCSK